MGNPCAQPAPTNEGVNLPPARVGDYITEMRGARAETSGLYRVVEDLAAGGESQLF